MNLDGETDRLRRRSLGWGAAFDLTEPGIDLGRDIQLTRGANGLDVDIVEGLENLGQSLSVALTSCRGADIFNVRYGFDGLNALAEEPDPLLARERIRIAVIQVLMRDPRVRRIVDVQLADGRLEPVAAGNRELDVRVVFETVLGETTALDLGKAFADG